MLKRIVRSTALGGAVALGGVVAFGGAAGSAGASTPAGRHQVNCARAPQRLGRIAKLDARTTAAIPKAEARLQQAQLAGNTARATFIEDRINLARAAQALAARATQRIESACPGATAR